MLGFFDADWHSTEKVNGHAPFFKPILSRLSHQKRVDRTVLSGWHAPFSPRVEKSEYAVTVV